VLAGVTAAGTLVAGEVAGIGVVVFVTTVVVVVVVLVVAALETVLAVVVVVVAGAGLAGVVLAAGVFAGAD